MKVYTREEVIYMLDLCLTLLSLVSFELLSQQELMTDVTQIVQSRSFKNGFQGRGHYPDSSMSGSN